MARRLDADKIDQALKRWHGKLTRAANMVKRLEAQRRRLANKPVTVAVEAKPERTDEATPVELEGGLPASPPPVKQKPPKAVKAKGRFAHLAKEVDKDQESIPTDRAAREARMQAMGFHRSRKRATK